MCVSHGGQGPEQTQAKQDEGRAGHGWATRPPPHPMEDHLVKGSQCPSPQSALTKAQYLASASGLRSGSTNCVAFNDLPTSLGLSFPVHKCKATS